MDGSGNVVVVGYSNGDYYTAKYAAANGALLWEKRYNGPANQIDEATAVAVDSSGNVVVTGYSGDSNGNDDYYTAKYAAMDGALLWEKRYNGAANGNDWVGGAWFEGPSSRCLALSANGMVAVAGSSDGNFGSGYTPDYATVVYRENLPAVAITRLANGSVRVMARISTCRNYLLEASIDLTNWTTVASFGPDPVPCGSDGPFEWAPIDPDAVNFPRRFYRLRTE